MAKKQKAPVIVAELGRPETPSETAARKANDSRLYRERKTINNLVFSLLVSVGLMILLVLIVPRGTDQWSDHSVDVAEAASQNALAVGVPLIAPSVDDTWLAKQAHIRPQKAGDITEWYIGYTTENVAYAAVSQSFTSTGQPVNETWISQQFEGQDPTGTETLGGLTWTVYDHPDRSPDESNVVFGMQTQVGAMTLLVYGTDRPEVLRMLAAEVASQAAALGLDDIDPDDPAR